MVLPSVIAPIPVILLEQGQTGLSNDGTNPVALTYYGEPFPDEHILTKTNYIGEYNLGDAVEFVVGETVQIMDGANCFEFQTGQTIQADLVEIELTECYSETAVCTVANQGAIIEQLIGDTCYTITECVSPVGIVISEAPATGCQGQEPGCVIEILPGDQQTTYQLQPDAMGNEKCFGFTPTCADENNEEIFIEEVDLELCDEVVCVNQIPAAQQEPTYAYSEVGELKCYSFKPTCADIDNEQILIEKVDDLELCEGSNCENPIAATQELITYAYAADSFGELKCFSFTPTCADITNEQIDITMVENSLCDNAGCQTPIAVAAQQTDYIYALNSNNEQVCFGLTPTCADPTNEMIVISEATAALCDANICNEPIPVTQQTLTYSWLDDGTGNIVCYSIALTCADVGNSKEEYNLVADTNCPVPPVTDDDDPPGPNNDGPGGSNNGPSGGPPLDMLSTNTNGTDLDIPGSLGLYNDNYCNQELNKQSCIDGYRRYNCGSYNVEGEFKEYKKECASCNNKKKDHNELGVDCGGVCIGCSATQQKLQAKSQQPSIITEIPTSFWKWLIPLLIIAILAGLIMGFILWLHEKHKEEPVTYTTETPLKNMPPEKLGLLKQYIKMELRKGFAKDQIIASLGKAGWKKEVSEYVFTQMQEHIMPSQYEEQLRRYITYYVQKGTPKEKIIDSLTKSGWKKAIIEKVLRKDF
ncbi:hypothetical protein HOH15_01260 [Candidatus Woesearchaeota archaeon]|nr:hypothetical protein [Candidatus Woesearchaeota archaeon]